MILLKELKSKRKKRENKENKGIVKIGNSVSLAISPQKLEVGKRLKAEQLHIKMMELR